jgi:hypothetical protein
MLKLEQRFPKGEGKKQIELSGKLLCQQYLGVVNSVNLIAST